VEARFLDAVKTFEGFASKSSWDYAQHTNGFGTKALYPGEQISVEEANRRFLAEIHEARSFVEAQAQGWDEGTKAALTSLTFNAGTRWASSGLGEAVRNLDIDAVRSRFLEYTKAGGEVLPGLVKRRLAEVTWIGEGIPSLPVPGSQPKPPTAGPTVAATGKPPQTALSTGADSAETEAAAVRTRSSELGAADTAAAERAASVAWMLLVLDLGTLGPQLADERRGDASATT